MELGILARKVVARTSTETTSSKERDNKSAHESGRHVIRQLGVFLRAYSARAYSHVRKTLVELIFQRRAVSNSLPGVFYERCSA